MMEALSLVVPKVTVEDVAMPPPSKNGSGHLRLRNSERRSRHFDRTPLTCGNLKPRRRKIGHPDVTGGSGKGLR